MIQSIYTSVSNADIVPCGKKGKPIKCEPIPLLRNNYLGEYRTELEKAKVRKNLGIADEQSLLWGNISGTIELQKDLVQYIEQKWTYTSDVAEGINTVKDALDYALYFISEYESNTEAIEELKVDISNIRTSISVLKEDLQREIDTNRKGINNLSEEIVKINEAIVELNNAIENIDVDKNILNWIKNSLQNSKTIELKENNSLEVILSTQEDNAIHLIEQEIGEETSSIILPGIYVKNLEPNGRNRLLTRKSSKSSTAPPKMEKPSQLHTLQPSTQGTDSTVIRNRFTREDFLRLAPVSSIPQQMIFSNTASTVDRAANAMNRKNRLPHRRP